MSVRTGSPTSDEQAGGNALRPDGSSMPVAHGPRTGGLPAVAAAARLDAAILAPYWKSLSLLVVIGVAIALFLGGAVSLPAFLVVYSCLAASYPFATVEKYHLETLQATLPFTRRAAVAGRYTLVTSALAAVATLGVLLAPPVAAIRAEELQVAPLVVLAATSFAGVCLVIALQYPIYFRLGYSRARIVALIPMFALFVLVMAVPGLVPDLVAALAPVAGIPWPMAVAGLVAVGLAVVAASAVLATRFYEHRDL